VRESAQYVYGRLDVDAAADLIRRSRTELASDCGVYGETNNRLSLMTDPLMEAFPRAKLIWLVRDGRDFVASEYQRGAYQQARKPPWAVSKWDRWRLAGDRAGVVTRTQWQSWDPFERICWQWGYVNGLIEASLSQVPADGWQRVRIEDWEQAVGSVASWLGLEQQTFAVARANRRRAATDPAGLDISLPNNVEAVDTWVSWTPSMRQCFERHAGSLMDSLYPEWRAEDGRWLPLATHDQPSSRPPMSSVDQAQLGELRVRSAELQSELDVLKRDPARLAVTFAGAARRSLRSRWPR
jgi:hypothetical protein